MLMRLGSVRVKKPEWTRVLSFAACQLPRKSDSASLLMEPHLLQGPFTRQTSNHSIAFYAVWAELSLVALISRASASKCVNESQENHSSANTHNFKPRSQPCSYRDSYVLYILSKHKGVSSLMDPAQHPSWPER
ncbi:hypothetical protein N657DRAFT_481346 [Parathielavia appendiculata]|uniref:Uncharacterized protein n=1 Tax=Parathielavia appendiculata TaxID=2587402 RepID=A0AAN6Z2Q6_9PEZI|nr:hypothetical protein N657DRAFT_481346 [Parathielavia appendiculata]